MVKKETIKEFLKLDWKKILIFIPLFLFLPLPFFVVQGIHPKGPEIDILYEEELVFSPFILIILHITTPFKNPFAPNIPVPLSVLEFIGEIWVSLLMNVAICYFLSCLIIFIYNKIRTKK